MGCILACSVDKRHSVFVQMITHTHHSCFEAGKRRLELSLPTRLLSDSQGGIIPKENMDELMVLFV